MQAVHVLSLFFLFIFNVNDFSSYTCQAALEKGKHLEEMTTGDMKNEEAVPAEDLGCGSESVKYLTSQINELTVSSSPTVAAPVTDSIESSEPGTLTQDIDKRIRALKKKV